MAIVMFCSYCGVPIASEAEEFCPHCGAPLLTAAQMPPQGAEQQMPPYGYAPAPYFPPVSYEEAETLLKVLCFFVPIAGIILYCLDKDKKPVAAKQCLNMSVISIAVSIGVAVLLWLIFLLVMLFPFLI